MSFVNVKTDTKWFAYNTQESTWYSLPSGLDKLTMQSNYSEAVNKGHAVAKFYYVKGTDIKVGHECILTDGIRNLPEDFLVKDMDKMIIINGDNSYSNIPRFGDKPINTPINPSIQAPF